MMVVKVMRFRVFGVGGEVLFLLLFVLSKNTFGFSYIKLKTYRKLEHLNKLVAEQFFLQY